MWNATGPATEVGTVWADQRMKAPLNWANLALGSTESGRLSAAKALHPAADIGPQRWPDKAANETLVMQNTDIFIINSNGNDKEWNASLWLTNFIDCPLVAAVQGADAPFRIPADDINAANSSKGLAKGIAYSFWYSSGWDREILPDDDFQTARITARSMTVDLISNATTNQGAVYAAQFSPNMALMPNQGGPQFMENMTNYLEKSPRVNEIINRVVREQMKNLLKDSPDMKDWCERIGLKADLESDSVDAVDGDDDPFAEQLATVFDKVTLNPRAPPRGGQTGYRLVFQDWPGTPQSVMQISPGCYTSKAQDGVYMPLKHASDMLHYQETAVECYLSAVVPHVANENTTEKNTLMSQGWNMGVALFTGLAPGSSLSIKVITALELTPRSDSNLAKFVESAPLLDKMAIQHTRAAMGKMPDAFPACDNALGTIANWIADALQQSGIPILSQAAGFAKRLNRASGGAATRWLDSIF